MRASSWSAITPTCRVPAGNGLGAAVRSTQPMGSAQVGVVRYQASAAGLTVAVPLAGVGNGRAGRTDQGQQEARGEHAAGSPHAPIVRGAARDVTVRRSKPQG